MAKRKRTTITLGKGPKNLDWQKREYAVAMRIKRGELVWSPLEHPDRFGARGDYVTLERAHELRTAPGVTPDLIQTAPSADFEAFARRVLAPRRLIDAYVRGEAMVA